MSNCYWNRPPFDITVYLFTMNVRIAWWKTDDKLTTIQLTVALTIVNN